MTSKWFAAVTLIRLVFGGCGPRMEVAHDKIMAAIDRWLGELDVKRKQIDHALTACQEALDIVTREKIRVQVQLEMLDKRVANSTARQRQIDEQLKRVKDSLAKGNADAATVAGSDDARQDAQRLLQERKSLVELIEGSKSTRSALTNAANTLSERQRVLEPRLDQFRLRLEEIDAKLACVKSLQTATTAANSSDTTLATRWRELETQLNDLATGVETELRFEDEKWSQLERFSAARNPKPSVESLLQEIEAIQPAPKP